jgi:CRISPR-associated protein Cas2
MKPSIPRVNSETFNAYRIVWIYVFFDLPTNTAKERKAASGFRKRLLKDGFGMMQFSVYVRHCPGYKNADVHIERIRKKVPPGGHIAILKITDKQFGETINLWGNKKKDLPPAPMQLEVF